MSLDDFRARLEQIISRSGASGDRRARASGLHDAMVEFKTALAENRQARGAAERELAAEQGQLENSVRRGGLAEGIGDSETARIAGEYAARHRERIGLLERKLSVIKDEIGWLEREYEGLKAQYQSARQQSGMQGAPPAPDLEDREFDVLKARADRAAAEQAVQAQLDLLKKKLGK